MRIDEELGCAKGGAGTGNPEWFWRGTIGFRGAVAHVQAFGLKAAAHDSCMLPAPAAPAPSAREFGSYRIHPVSRVASGCEGRSEEHTSELQSLMRISYAVFCFKNKQTNRIAPCPPH